MRQAMNIDSIRLYLRYSPHIGPPPLGASQEMHDASDPLHIRDKTEYECMSMNVYEGVSIIIK